jgi:hypothetical protein
MVDIVIVNWNSRDYLLKCVTSILLRENEVSITSIFIIDNNSSDNSINLIPENPKITNIKNKTNMGFAKACNQGFQLCNSQYVLLLNPDVQLLDNTLKDCLQFMETHAEVDILGCQLLNDEGKITSSCARFPTPLHIFYDASGLSKIFPKVFKPATLMTDWDHQTSRFVPQVMGAFMWMRPSIFKKIGFFDEQFFVYFEELDFSKRLAKSGGHTFYNAEIKSIHSGGGTTNSVKAFRLFLFWQSRLQYAKKHFSIFGYLVVILSTYIIEPISRCILFLIKGDLKGIKEVGKGYQYLIKKKNNFQSFV